MKNIKTKILSAFAITLILVSCKKEPFIKAVFSVEEENNSVTGTHGRSQFNKDTSTFNPKIDSCFFGPRKKVSGDFKYYKNPKKTIDSCYVGPQGKNLDFEPVKNDTICKLPAKNPWDQKLADTVLYKLK